MSDLRVESHPFDYDCRARFVDARCVLGYGGADVHAAEGEGAWWIITDEGALADFLDPDDDADLLAGLVKLRRFDDRSAWEAEVAAMRRRAAADRDRPRP